MRTVIVTGGAGFVGHHFVEHFLRKTDWNIVVLDRLGYSSTWDRLRDVKVFDDKRVRALSVDMSKPINSGLMIEIGYADAIFHLGAETHVDNSISDPLAFIHANVLGTHYALMLAKHLGARFFYFSTDEVFGPAPQGVNYREDDAHNPGNPYSATKSGGEMLVKAYANTYGIQCTITRCMNIFGERQHVEKYIPLVIKKVLAGEHISIHSDKTRTKAGSRFYIHARNVADAYLHIVTLPDDVWHIVGEVEVDNLTLAQNIAKILGKPLRYELIDFHSSRPGHDLRYALSGEKLARAGWMPPVDFDKSLKKTVEWYVQNPKWLKAH
jgi:dTDP-glucose 4,6-dehydratase